MKIRYFLLMVLILSISCSQSEYSYTIRFPYTWLDVQGYGGNIDKQNIVEPSGICFHPFRKTLFVVSDEGEIFEIDNLQFRIFTPEIKQQTHNQGGVENGVGPQPGMGKDRCSYRCRHQAQPRHPRG